MMATILLFATLATRGDYLFVDVSGIDVTGDDRASVGETIRGEHVARFYEFLAESRWMLDTCGAEVPGVLRSWDPPKPREINALQPSIDVYNAAAAADETSSVRWVSGDAPEESVLCFDRTYPYFAATNTMEDIAAEAWHRFTHYPLPRGGSTDYSHYNYPAAVVMPTITNGCPIRAADIDTLNLRTTSLSHKWHWLGANRAWWMEDASGTVTEYPRQHKTYYDGAPFAYTAGYVPRGRLIDDLFSADRPTGDPRSDHFDSSYDFYNVLRGDYEDPIVSYTTVMTGGYTPRVFSVRGEIVGTRGIALDHVEMFVFLCVWKTGWNDGDDAVMRVKVFAKRFYRYARPPKSIGELVDEAYAETEQPPGNSHSAFVALLFVAHGMAFYTPNATD